MENLIEALAEYLGSAEGALEVLEAVSVALEGEE